MISLLTNQAEMKAAMVGIGLIVAFVIVIAYALRDTRETYQVLVWAMIVLGGISVLLLLVAFGAAVRLALKAWWQSRSGQGGEV